MKIVKKCAYNLTVAGMKKPCLRLVAHVFSIYFYSSLDGFESVPFCWEAKSLTSLAAFFLMFTKITQSVLKSLNYDFRVNKNVRPGRE